MRKNEALKLVMWGILSGIAGGITSPLILIIVGVFRVGFDIFLLSVGTMLALLGAVSGLSSGILVGCSFGLVYKLFHLQLGTVYRWNLYTVSILSFIIGLLLYQPWIDWIDAHTSLFEFNFG